MSNDQFMPIDGALDFDSIFTADTKKPEFTVLPEGVYPFLIEKVERTRVSEEARNGKVSQYAGCPMAAVDFRITGKNENGEDTETVRTEYFILHTKFLWKISQLFISVGLAKNGEQFRPDWMGLITRTGMCEVGVREYTKRDGTKGKSNEIKEFLEPTSPAAPAPAWAKGF